MQWEYRTEKLETKTRFPGRLDFETAGPDKALNEFGRSGWELVNVFDINTLNGGSIFVVAVFKRLKAET